jgi:bifunctional non-homologous end joining protein LigD
MPLSHTRGPFSHPDWICELKWDGNGHEFKSFSTLNDALLDEFRAQSAVLDGEIVCLDQDGKPQFRDLLFRQGEPRFVVFDLLWCEGEDLRYLPLGERKQPLRCVVPQSGERLLFCDYVEQDSEGLFRLICDHDLEGIAAKRKSDPYLPEEASLLKIRYPGYSQWVGREQLFERERHTDPAFHLWDECTLACVSVSHL